MTTPSSHQAPQKTDPRVEAYTRYRDTLIQYLFASKAQRYLRQLESLEGSSNRALRTRFDDRSQRLTDRLAKLQAALNGFRNNPLTDYRKASAGSVRAGGCNAASMAAAACSATAWLPPAENGATPSVNVNGLPMIGAVDVHGNPYGSTTFDGGQGFATASDGEWLLSSDSDTAPTTNINGLPMVGAVDIHGNAFGTNTFDGGHGL